MSSNAQRGWQRAELGYCSNVHPGETLDAVQQVISTAIAGVRSARSLATMGSGLWLSDAAARQLDGSGRAADIFSGLLADNGVHLFTLNGFPIGGFHDSVVKEKVYTPDWFEPARLEYTLRLARILSASLPAECTTGTISTLPLGFTENWNSERHDTALRTLCLAVRALEQLEADSGHLIRICLEMEPGCVLEQTGQMVSLFTESLPRVAADLNIGEDLLRRHLGVCFDVCHQAVMFEDPYKSLMALHRENIVVGKIQLSSALEMQQPGDAAARQALSGYAEPRYLHQVRTRTAAGELKGVMDVPDALDAGLLPVETPWRIHFHIPVQAAEVAGGQLHTTRDAIGRTLDFLRDNPEMSPHLEVETYTWHVLPPDIRPGSELELQQGIANELAWVEGQMQQRGLLADAG